MALFSKPPKPPTPAEVAKDTPPPTRDEAREVIDRNDELRQRRGRASTVLRGLNSGASTSGLSAGKVLTGVAA